jgi:hypothetical protein
MISKRQMRFMFATEVARDPVGHFLSREQTGGLEDVSFAVNPVQLSRPRLIFQCLRRPSRPILIESGHRSSVATFFLAWPFIVFLVWFSVSRFR